MNYVSLKCHNLRISTIFKCFCNHCLAQFYCSKLVYYFCILLLLYSMRVGPNLCYFHKLFNLNKTNTTIRTKLDKYLLISVGEGNTFLRNCPRQVLIMFQ